LRKKEKRKDEKGMGCEFNDGAAVARAFMPSDRERKKKKGKKERKREKEAPSLNSHP